MNTPITRESLKDHFSYNWWKYLLVVVTAYFVFGPRPIGLLYTVTTHTPPEKEVSFYVYGQINEKALNNYMENVRVSEMPDMESMQPSMLMPDDNYGPMQLLTYAAAGDGNVYLLPRDRFISLASQGLLAPLEDDEELMALLAEYDVDLQRGWRKNDNGENHLCGIPQDKLPGLGEYAYADNGFLCVLITNKNPENTMKFFRILVRDMLRSPAAAD